MDRLSRASLWIRGLAANAVGALSFASVQAIYAYLLSPSQYATFFVVISLGVFGGHIAALGADGRLFAEAASSSNPFSFIRRELFSYLVPASILALLFTIYFGYALLTHSFPAGIWGLVCIITSIYLQPLLSNILSAAYSCSLYSLADYSTSGVWALRVILGLLVLPLRSDDATGLVPFAICAFIYVVPQLFVGLTSLLILLSQVSRAPYIGHPPNETIKILRPRNYPFYFLSVVSSLLPVTLLVPILQASGVDKVAQEAPLYAMGLSFSSLILKIPQQYWLRTKKDFLGPDFSPSALAGYIYAATLKMLPFQLLIITGVALVSSFAFSVAGLDGYHGLEAVFAQFSPYILLTSAVIPLQLYFGRERFSRHFARTQFISCLLSIGAMQFSSYHGSIFFLCIGLALFPGVQVVILGCYLMNVKDG